MGQKFRPIQYTQSTFSINPQIDYTHESTRILDWKSVDVIKAQLYNHTHNNNKQQQQQQQQQQRMTRNKRWEEKMK